jgi:serine/threonine protein phosphatase PrpC
MTTDGLVDFGGPTEAASEHNIQATLESEEIPALACLRLIMLANEGGGEDNIGVAVVRVTRQHDASDRMTLTQVFPAVSGLC